MNKKQRSGFTIVELLIVIVIIGILAAITIVSYVGIAKKANESAVKSDLANASKKIKLYHVEHGTYPASMPLDGSTNRNCPTGPTDYDYCIKPSNGYFTYSAPTPGVDFTLRLDYGTIAYSITKDMLPTQIIATPITAIGSITGTAQIGQTLTAGAITPGGATVSYRWQSASSAAGVYSDIAGATGNTYVISPSVMGRYIKVVATGTGEYDGSQISSATTQVPVDNTNWLAFGSQTWARANLNVGTMITGATNQTNNGGTNVVEKYCYSDSASNCTTYGALYQWGEAMKYSTGEKAQGVCPAGSHIPSNDELTALEMSAGLTAAHIEAGYDARKNISTHGINLRPGGSSGMEIKLSGMRTWIGGYFGSLATNGTLWSSTEGINTSEAGYMLLSSSFSGAERGSINKGQGHSIRCVGN